MYFYYQRKEGKEETTCATEFYTSLDFTLQLQRAFRILHFKFFLIPTVNIDEEKNYFDIFIDKIKVLPLQDDVKMVGLPIHFQPGIRPNVKPYYVSELVTFLRSTNT